MPKLTLSSFFFLSKRVYVYIVTDNPMATWGGETPYHRNVIA